MKLEKLLELIGIYDQIVIIDGHSLDTDPCIYKGQCCYIYEYFREHNILVRDITKRKVHTINCYMNTIYLYLGD